MRVVLFGLALCARISVTFLSGLWAPIPNKRDKVVIAQALLAVGSGTSDETWLVMLQL